jgi:type I restriction enzyme S subunit
VTNPKGWTVDKLGNAITFVGGSQPPKETFRNEEQVGYVRLVQIRDFKTDRYKTYIPKELARRQFDADDVMIARYGPPVFQILRGLSGSYNVALMKAAPTEKATKDFIFYLLQTPAIHDTVVENSSRTAGQSGVNLDLLNNLEIPMPPVSVQQEIGSAMRQMEKMKTAREQANLESESLFNALVQRAFRGEL